MMSSAVIGIPRILLRAEGATLFVVAAILYARVGNSRTRLQLPCYLGGARTGAIAYNAAHTLLGPLLLATAGLLLSFYILIPLTLIWVAHIGFDRLLGYDLKYAAGFSFTYLGRIGRASSDVA